LTNFVFEDLEEEANPTANLTVNQTPNRDGERVKRTETA